MTHRIMLAAVGAVAVLMSAVMLAPSAQAANLGTITWNGTTLTPSSLNAQVGDTFTFSNSTNYDAQLIGSLRDSGFSNCTGAGSTCVVMTGGSGSFTVLGVGQVQIENNFTTAIVGSFYTDGSSSSGSSSSSTPPPVVQQFGKPASGTCDAAQPAGLNWAGVPSGGWAHSWSLWMNDGNGGFVCTRTLVYSTTESKWILG